MAPFVLAHPLGLGFSKPLALNLRLHRTSCQLPLYRSQFTRRLGLPIELVTLESGLQSLLTRHHRLATTLQTPVFQATGHLCCI